MLLLLLPPLLTRGASALRRLGLDAMPAAPDQMPPDDLLWEDMWGYAEDSLEDSVAAFAQDSRPAWQKWLRRRNTTSSAVCAAQLNTAGVKCTYLSQLNCGGRNTQTFASLSKQTGVPHCYRMRESCAIVGSSVHLLSTAYGRRIDSHEEIIRVNGAPAGDEDNGFSEHVGVRTTTGWSHAGHMRYKGSDHMCIIRDKIKMPCDGGDICRNRPSRCERCRMNELKCPHLPVKPGQYLGNITFVLDHVHPGLADELVTLPTAGFKAFIFAIRHCKQVTMFGFGPGCQRDDSGAKRAVATGSRYYPSQPANLVHHYKRELELLNRADRLGAASIFPARLRKGVRAQRVDLVRPDCWFKADP